MPTEIIEDGLKLHVSGSTVYAALKNLLKNHYGITREKIMDEIMRISNVENIVKDYLNNANMRAFISGVAKEAVYKLAAEILREEARAAINGKVRITFG